jgi:NAD(P)-dependent dehydrogenase (short-subunit alcohol dehydrogenase family)/acyl carrier protein
VAARALQFDKAPPVVNHRQLDPALEGLKLGKGESGHFEYALRMAAGFGSQGNYILLRQRSKGSERIEDATTYARWLSTISGIERAELDHRGRLLVVRDTKPGSIMVDRPDVGSLRPSASGSLRPSASGSLRPSASGSLRPSASGSLRPSASSQVSIAPNPAPVFGGLKSIVPPPPSQPSGARQSVPAPGQPQDARQSVPAPNQPRSNRQLGPDAKALVLREVALLTGYSEEVLDLDMELEADLGIDTVKQATLLAILAERIGQTDLEKLSLSEFPTLRSLIELCEGSNDPDSRGSSQSLVAFEATPVLPPVAPLLTNHEHAVAAAVREVIAAVTGYPQTTIGDEMELEADLGIDTVKQATILATLGEKLAIPNDDSLKMSDFGTVAQLIQLFSTQVASQRSSACPAPVFSSDQQATPAEVEPRTALPLPTGNHDVTADVLEVIASVTGYSCSIIGQEMELESDLGIDTVKQATILAMLGERLSVPNDDSLRMSELGTVGQLIELFSARVPPPPPNRPATPEKVLGAEDPQPGNLKVDALRSSAPRDVTTALYEIVGNLTPYPADMLEGTLTLEDDLGLHSDARANLVARLRQDFALPPDFACAATSTLAEVTAAIECASATASESSPNAPASPARFDLGRQTLALRPAPANYAGLESLAGKRVWLWGQNERCLALLEGWLRTQGAATHCLLLAGGGKGDNWATSAEALLLQGRPDVVIDLTASPDNDSPLALPPEEFRSAITEPIEARFALCKLLAARKAQPSRLIVATALDGVFAIGSEPKPNAPSPLYGLYLGFYKSIRKEWHECHVAILDLNPTDWTADGAAALNLLGRELVATGAGVELCYVDGLRHRVVTIDGASTSSEEPAVLDAKDVVVATGGGAGVTARLVVELARGSHSKFALLGRTPLLPHAEALNLDDEGSRQACKAEIQQRLQASGARVTPALIERQWAQLARSAEIFSTLTTLRKLGCAAEYFVADVCQPAAVEQVLSDVRAKFGPITTLIHGAGLEVSHRLEQKSLEEFRAVYQTKALGAYHLHWFTRNDPLRRIVAMSSIASRYGNFAQADYCAGNGFLDLLIRTEHRSAVSAKSLLWSGWRELGMAWRNSFVRQHAERQGLCLVAPEVAVAAARAELSSASGHREVVFHLGLGDLADADQVLTALNRSPLIDWVETQEDQVKTAHRRFAVERDAFLDQHRFAGTPFMPGVGFMEMMAETVELLEPIASRAGSEYVFTDLHFLEGFKLHREAPREVRLDVAAGPTPSRHAMTVRSTFRPRTGLPPQQLDYAKAIVELRPKSSPPAFSQDFVNRLTEQTTYARIYEDAATRQKNVAMGPLFNDARRMLEDTSRVRFGKEGIETWIPLPKAQLDHPAYPLDLFRINPAFLDALHQAGAVLAIQLTNCVYLPVGADQFTVFSAPRHDGHYRVQARLLSLDETSATYDMLMTHEDGSPCAQIKGSRFRRITA